MSTILNRREFTEAVKARVAAGTSKPCGKAEAPSDGGWQGEVNDSNFVPYSVITPMSSPQGQGPPSDPQADVRLVYAITAIGISADQVEWMADKAREAVVGLKKQTVTVTDNANIKVRFVYISDYGGVERGTEEPPFYVQTDIVVFDTTPA